MIVHACAQGMQFQYARAAMEIESARVLVYNAARLKEQGRPFVAEAAMAKLHATEVNSFALLLLRVLAKRQYAVHALVSEEAAASSRVDISIALAANRGKRAVSSLDECL